MKSLAICLLTIFLSLSVAQAAPREEPGEPACAPSSPSHAHRYSDMRFVDIEILNVDECGFTYIDIEERTVGLDHYLRFASDFSMARVEEVGPRAETMRTIRYEKDKLRKGMRGVAVFCEHCRTVLALRLR